MANKPYQTFTLTLTLANTNYNLLALCQAIAPNCPVSAMNILVQADPANGAAIVRLGDSSLSDTQYGYKLLQGDTKPYISDRQNLPFGSIYARSDTATSKVSVEVITC